MKIIDKEATCEAIRKKILSKGLTPYEIRTALMLESVQAVYKWLSPKNKTVPSIDNLFLLSHLLGCTVEELIVTKDAETVDKKVMSGYNDSV